jgi:hypothetical protein
MFSMSKDIEKALDAAFDYLMSLDDKEFYAGLDKHANGDIAQAMIELGAAEYEWELYLKKKQLEDSKRTGQNVMIINKMESVVLSKRKVENLVNRNKYKNQAASMSSVHKIPGYSAPEYDGWMAA